MIGDTKLFYFHQQTLVTVKCNLYFYLRFNFVFSYKIRAWLSRLPFSLFLSHKITLFKVIGFFKKKIQAE